MLCLIGVADIILNCLATYTRAQKIEEAYLLSLFSAALIVGIGLLGYLFDLEFLLFFELYLLVYLIPISYLILEDIELSGPSLKYLLIALSVNHPKEGLEYLDTFQFSLEIKLTLMAF